MIIAGIQKTSLIDYPKKICTVIFVRGCNFFCGFCHNPELVIPEKYNKKIALYQIFDYLNKRKKVIDAVTITGGEPTIYKDLPDFIKKIKRLGYKIKLDTNGSNPIMLKYLIDKKLVDYIAMDIKNAPNKYTKTICRDIDIKKIKQSVKIIMTCGIDYEFRTTVVPGLHTKTSFKNIGIWLKNANIYYLQKFRPGKTIDPVFSNLKTFTQDELIKFKAVLAPYIKNVKIR